MISIIVPVYKAQNYIRQTIETVVRQTYRDWELLLVDDCSPDESARIIEEEIARYEAAALPRGRIRLLRKPRNEGAARARNTGLAAARGRYIAFLDADDLWYPQKLENELKFMEKHRAAFVCTSYQFGDENGVPTGKVARVRRRLFYKEALSRTIIFTSTVLIDTQRVDKSLLQMPEIASEDTATWWRILQSGVEAYGLDEVLAIYRRPAQSLSSDKGKAVTRIWNLYRQVASLGRAKAAFYLLQWAWNATMRRVVDDGVRSHMETLKRFTVVQLSLIGLLLHTAIYAYVWFQSYYPILRAPRISQEGYDFGFGLKLYFRGHLLILAIYFLLLLFLSRTNGGMKTGYWKPGQILTTQVAALGLTNVLTYAQLSLMRNWLLPVLPLLYAYLAQIALAALWSYLADVIYRRVFPPRETLVVHGETDVGALARVVEQFNSRQDRFQVMKNISVAEGMEQVKAECLNWYGGVVLGGLSGADRQELLEFCYAHYIRVYLVPEVFDLLLQGTEQLDLFDTPVLELKEYSIRWDERVLKRLIDLVVSAMLLALSSPVLLARVCLAKARGERTILERTECVTKDGRRFIRHTFARAGFGQSLPMLADVFCGHLSMVGPQTLPAETEQALLRRDSRFFYRRRVKAGYTGYAASLGRMFGVQGPVSAGEAEEILKLDLLYMQHFSLLQDGRLLLGMAGSVWWKHGKRPRRT